MKLCHQNSYDLSRYGLYKTSKCLLSSTKILPAEACALNCEVGPRWIWFECPTCSTSAPSDWWQRKITKNARTHGWFLSRRLSRASHFSHQLAFFLQCISSWTILVHTNHWILGTLHKACCFGELTQPSPFGKDFYTCPFSCLNHIKLKNWQLTCFQMYSTPWQVPL